MTEQELTEILEDDIPADYTVDDHALAGLLIIAKYGFKLVLQAAEHDTIFSVGVEELAEAGITKEDARRLRELRWFVSYDALACYV
jgi:hypothetical protein